MSYANPNLSYPKPRNVLTKIIPMARTDSSTAKCVLPKGCVVMAVTCLQTSAAVTNPATWTVGWSGTTTALLNAFSAGTTSVGLAHPGVAVGASVMTILDSDKQIIASFGGTSASGGVGYVFIDYFQPGPGEGVDD